MTNNKRGFSKIDASAEEIQDKFGVDLYFFIDEFS